MPDPQPLTEPYRPSNGTEGEMFQSRFCDRCQRDAEFRRSKDGKDGCKILVRMLAYDIGDAEYPRQIVRDAGAAWGEGNERCTAFRPIGAPPATKRKQKPASTLPLFRE